MCRSCHGDCWPLVANQRNALDKDLLPKCGQVQSTRLPGAEWSRGGGAEWRKAAVVCRGGAVRARQMRSDFANNVPEGASTSRRPQSQRGTRLCGKAQATCRSSLRPNAPEPASEVRYYIIFLSCAAVWEKVNINQISHSQVAVYNLMRLLGRGCGSGEQVTQAEND